MNMFPKIIQPFHNIITPPITSHILKYSPTAKQIKQNLVKSEIYGTGYSDSLVIYVRKQIMLNKTNINHEDFYLGSVNDVLECSRKNIINNNLTIKALGLVFTVSSLIPMIMLGDPTFFAICGSIGVIGSINRSNRINKYNQIIDDIYSDLRNKPLDLLKDKSLIYEQNRICDDMIDMERRLSSGE